MIDRCLDPPLQGQRKATGFSLWVPAVGVAWTEQDWRELPGWALESIRDQEESSSALRPAGAGARILSSSSVVYKHVRWAVPQIRFTSELEWNDGFNLAGVRNHLWCWNEMIKSSGGSPPPSLGELNTLLRRRRDLHHQKTLQQSHIWLLNEDAVIQVEKRSACSHRPGFNELQLSLQDPHEEETYL